MVYFALLALWGASIFLVIFGTYCVHARVGVGRSLRTDTPPITILKPLCGAESGIEDNLRSFFLLLYPDFELLFAVADDADPVVPIVKKLIDQYPKVKAMLLIHPPGGRDLLSPNPKVGTMLPCYNRARNDLILISDSNTRVHWSFLGEMVKHMGPNVGVVAASVVAVESRTFAGRIEAAAMNTWVLRWSWLAAACGLGYSLGKAMMFQKSDAERFGGLEGVGHYISEDFVIGAKMKRLGLRVVLPNESVLQIVGDNYSWGTFWNRHIRWGRLRRMTIPFAFYGELTQNSFVGAALLGVVCHGLHWSMAWLVPHFLLWGAADISLMCCCSCRDFNFTDILAWLCHELIYVPRWLGSLVGRRVNWRGNMLRIKPGGRL